MTRFLKRITQRLRCENGTATIEFVMAVPVLLTVFMASFESGLLMTRSIMLEQAVDITMRELRLGHYPMPNAALLKEEICKRTLIFTNCQSNIMVEMTRVSTATWSLPQSEVTCVDREEDIQPVTVLQIGQQNDVMLVRVCVIQDAIFPSSSFGLNMATDAQGGYGLVAVSAFVTEP